MLDVFIDGSLKEELKDCIELSNEDFKRMCEGKDVFSATITDELYLFNRELIREINRYNSYMPKQIMEYWKENANGGTIKYFVKDGAIFKTKYRNHVQASIDNENLINYIISEFPKLNREIIDYLIGRRELPSVAIDSLHTEILKINESGDVKLISKLYYMNYSFEKFLLGVYVFNDNFLRGFLNKLNFDFLIDREYVATKTASMRAILIGDKLRNLPLLMDNTLRMECDRQCIIIIRELKEELISELMDYDFSGEPNMVIGVMKYVESNSKYGLLLDAYGFKKNIKEVSDAIKFKRKRKINYNLKEKMKYED